MEKYQVVHRSPDGTDGLYTGKGELVAGWRELERHGYITWYLLHCSDKRLAYIAKEMSN